MSNPLGNWIDLSAVSNLYIQTYVKGFVDMSGGNLILRNNNIYVNSGDLSLGGRLLTIGDASLGGNLYVGKKLTVNGDVSMNGNLVVYGNLMVQQVSNANIINTSVNNYQLVVTEDISLNGRIIVSSDVSLAGRLFVTGATTATGLITANGGLTTGGSSVLTSAGTTTLTGATTATGLITANGGVTTGGSSVLTSAGTTTLTGATTATGLITANGGVTTYTINANTPTTTLCNLFTNSTGSIAIGSSTSKVGIGTTSPVCPLHVNSGNIGFLTGMSSYYSYNSSGPGGSVAAGPVGTSLVALFIGQVVVQGTVFAAGSTNLSDSRIKKNIQQIDNSVHLKNLRQFKPVQFQHIDSTISENKSVYGFIAQEVEESMPMLISKTTTYIPNIYEPAKVINSNIITLNEKTTTIFNCDSNGIDNSGNPIKIKLYDVSGNDIYTKISKIIDDKTFQISDTINESIAFVYGQEVHDMRSIDTNQIISITVAAVQEIDTIVQSQQETIIALENRLSAIEARLLAAGI
jgi:hypothetical protein